MEKLICPGCEIALTRIMTDRGVIWRCEKCDGRAVGLALLRGAFTASSINPIWQHAIHQQGSAGRACPSCQQKMIELPLATEAPVNVEVCRLCQMIWFDAGEVSALQPLPPPPAGELPLAPKARQAIAIAKVRSMAVQARESDYDSAATTIWRAIAYALWTFLR